MKGTILKTKVTEPKWKYSSSCMLKTAFLLLIGLVLVLQFGPYSMQWVMTQWDVAMSVEYPYDNFTEIYEYIMVNETMDKENSSAIVQKIVKKKIAVCQPKVTLGPFRVDVNARPFEETEKFYPDLTLGGSYTPPNCRPRDNVAVVIPYRNREENLKIFLYNIHAFLHRQQIKYTIFVVEQDDKNNFNRGKLLNVGYKEALKLDGTYTCFIFHDVDKIPDNLRNIYDCRQAPKEMMVNHKATNEHRYHGLFYHGYFGGVTALSKDQFKRINGMSNSFWGWGGEDDDFYRRVTNKRFKVRYLPGPVGSYTVLSHHDDMHLNKDRFRLLSNRAFRSRIGRDGLRDLKYTFIKLHTYKLYTLITVKT